MNQVNFLHANKHQKFLLHIHTIVFGGHTIVFDGHAIVFGGHGQTYLKICKITGLQYCGNISRKR